MRIVYLCTTVVARFLLSAIFLSAAVGNILNWHETEKLVISTLCEWQTYVGFSDRAISCLNILTPWAPLLLITATFFELIGGLLLLLGVHEKIGATLLVLFLIPTTVLFHPFWVFDGSVRELQSIMFMKNMAILGGLLMVLLHGAQGKKESGFGSISLD
jgi:uncharacterized membrane protein YphA (DoxX/SURF4 family)